MRKSIGAVLAVASLLPLVMTATPASAATGLTCTKLTGTVTWTPALPKIGSKTLVKSKVVAKGSFSGCTGTPGITSGKFVFTQLPGTTGSNCSMLVASKTQNSASVVTTWNNGKTTTSAKTTVTKIGQQGLAGVVTTNGKNTSGTVFVGQTATATTLFTPLKGGCVSGALSSASVALKAGTKVVIK